MPSTTFPLLELPDAVLSTALGSFLDGKSMSTFLIVVSGCKQCNNSEGNVLRLLRNALVHRYCQLLHRLRLVDDGEEDTEEEELKDVLMVLREDIRTSKSTKKFPQWCAVLDYFEGQLQECSENIKNNAGWIVWCGPIETAFGSFQGFLRCTTEWTLGALQYWHHEIALQQFSIEHPSLRDVNEDNYDLSTFYGRIGSLTEEGQRLLGTLYLTLEHDPEHWKHYLVLRSRIYEEEPPEFFTPKTGDPTELFCYWDSEDQTYDWEDALDKLGENVIRIMTRCRQEKGSFP